MGTSARQQHYRVLYCQGHLTNDEACVLSAALRKKEEREDRAQMTRAERVLEWVSWFILATLGGRR